MSKPIRHSWVGINSRKTETIEWRDDWAVDLNETCPWEGASQDIMHELIRLAQQEKAQGREISRLRGEISRLEKLIKREES